MLSIKLHKSIREINKDAWGACFPGNLEGYDYLLATEEAGIAGFNFYYITAAQEDKIIAATYFFTTEYNLETTLQGTAKKITLYLRKLFPHLLKFNLACIGSPVTENAYFGFINTLAESEKIRCIDEILSEFERFAASNKIKLLGIKDINEENKNILSTAAESKKYTQVAGMPGAFLKIDFANIEGYFEKLSYSTRKNIRRKLKSQTALRIETVTDITNIIEPIYGMYLATRSRSDWQFETLTKKYFQSILQDLDKNGFCTVYYANGKLVAANFFLVNENTLLDKYFCAHAEDAREYNLYFISWIENIKFCLARGIKKYEAGQAGYENKRKLGCDFQPNWMYFRHLNPLVNFILKLASPMLAGDMEAEADEK